VKNKKHKFASNITKKAYPRSYYYIRFCDLTNQICFAHIGYIFKTKNSMKDNLSSNFDNP